MGYSYDGEIHTWSSGPLKQEPEKQTNFGKQLAIMLGVVSLSGGAILAATMPIRHEDRHAHAAPPPSIREFKLPTTSVTPAARLAVGHIATKEFNALPKYRDGESLHVARRVTIAGNSCKELTGTHLAAGDGIVADANELDQAALGTPLVVGESAGGVVSICNMSHEGDDGYNNYPAITVAIQEYPLQRVG